MTTELCVFHLTVACLTWLKIFTSARTSCLKSTDDVFQVTSATKDEGKKINLQLCFIKLLSEAR